MTVLLVRFEVFEIQEWVNNTTWLTVSGPFPTLYEAKKAMNDKQSKNDMRILRRAEEVVAERKA